MATPSERRKNRSDVPEEAVRRYLETVAQARGMTALVLADEEGRVVGVGDSIDLPELAAAGRRCARGLDAGEGLDALASGADAYAHAWTSQGRGFTLVSVGARVQRLRDVVTTVQRIADGRH